MTATKDNRTTALLIGITVVAVALAVMFAWRVPFDARSGWNPDETSHLDYLRLLWENKAPVRFTAGDPAYFETHQPPLYYLFALIPYVLTGGNVFAVRLAAVPIQVATILLAFRAGRDLFPSRPEVGLGAAAFVAFLPTQAQLSGAINNDGLTTLISVAILWRLGLLVRGTATDLRSSLLVGVLFGLGLYTKLTVIQLIPAMAVACLLAPTGDLSRKVRQGAVFLAVAIGVGILIAAPWLIRNTLLYGDPLNIKIFPLTAGENTPTPTMMMPLFEALGMGGSWTDYWRINAVRTFYTFFAIMPPTGSQALTPPILGLVAVILLSLGGLVGAFRAEKEGGVPPDERRNLLLMLVCLLFIVPFFVRFNLQFFQAQGRYFYPALLPVALICVTGWRNVLGERRGWLGALLPGAVLLVMCLLQWLRFGTA
ncbi:MAG: glycosyltransferase family 39 protein [Capsulimonadales bacterium]|nr:glycosyltransferase family 39 protein [Capsulimonadales bacterium]